MRDEYARGSRLDILRSIFCNNNAINCEEIKMLKSKYGFLFNTENNIWEKNGYILLRHTFVPFVFYSDMIGTSYYSEEKPGHSFRGLYRHSKDYVAYDVQYYLEDSDLREQIRLLCRSRSVQYWQKMNSWDFQLGGDKHNAPIDDKTFDEAFGLEARNDNSPDNLERINKKLVAALLRCKGQ